jgi:hypothetical protein
METNYFFNREERKEIERERAFSISGIIEYKDYYLIPINTLNKEEKNILKK